MDLIDKFKQLNVSFVSENSIDTSFSAKMDLLSIKYNYDWVTDKTKQLWLIQRLLIYQPRQKDKSEKVTQSQ